MYSRQENTVPVTQSSAEKTLSPSETSSTSGINVVSVNLFWIRKKLMLMQAPNFTSSCYLMKKLQARQQHRLIWDAA